MMESILNTLTGYIVGLYIGKVTEAIEERCANNGEHTEHTNWLHSWPIYREGN